jgi:hypothetical protein
MAEGDNEKNVIRPVFGQRSGSRLVVSQPEVPRETAQTIEQKTQARAELVMKDLLYRRENKERVKQAWSRADEATNFIFDVVKYRKNDESVSLRQGAIGSMSLEQICDEFLNSTNKEWAQKPPYWGALHLEMHERLMTILEVEKSLPPESR